MRPETLSSVSSSVGATHSPHPEEAPLGSPRGKLHAVSKDGQQTRCSCPPSRGDYSAVIETRSCERLLRLRYFGAISAPLDRAPQPGVEQVADAVAQQV